MSELLSVRRLVEHYVDKYKLDMRYLSDSSPNTHDNLGTFIQEVRRILTRTKVGNQSLWELIKPDKGTRHISVEDFEKYCFKDWLEYIEKTERIQDKVMFAKDKERWNKEYAEAHRLNEAVNKLVNDVNRGFENYAPTMEECEYDAYAPVVSEEELLKKGHEIMIEAIFSIFYKSFNWELLKHDMLYSQVDTTYYNPIVTAENIKAIERLKDISKYVGELREITE